MDRKDERLSEIFGAYFEEDKPSPEVLQKAGSYLKEKGGKRSRWKPALRIASVFACIVLFFTAVFVLLPAQLAEWRQGTAGDPAVSESFFSDSSLKFRAVNRPEAVETAEFGFVQEDGDTTVVSEKYYVFFDKESEQPMFVMAQVGVLRGGRREDLSVIVELTEAHYDRLADFYTLENSSSVGGVNVLYETELKQTDGEYVSKAYFMQENKRFFLEVMSGIEESLEHYLNEFI